MRHPIDIYKLCVTILFWLSLGTFAPWLLFALYVGTPLKLTPKKDPSK